MTPAERRALIAHLRRQAGDCECTGCDSLRHWASELEDGREDEGENVLFEEHCDCPGCTGTRYAQVLAEGNPEPNS